MSPHSEAIDQWSSSQERKTLPLPMYPARAYIGVIPPALWDTSKTLNQKTLVCSRFVYLPEYKPKSSEALCVSVTTTDLTETQALVFCGADINCTCGELFFSQPLELAQQAGQKLQEEFLKQNRNSARLLCSVVYDEVTSSLKMHQMQRGMMAEELSPDTLSSITAFNCIDIYLGISCKIFSLDSPLDVLPCREIPRLYLGDNQEQYYVMHHPITHNGYLYKTSSMTKLVTDRKAKEEFSRRWCLLNEGTLRYFENNHNSSPNGEIRMDEIVCVVVVPPDTHGIQHFSDINQMNVHNLAIVFGPTLFQTDGQNYKPGRVVEDLINFFMPIFGMDIMEIQKQLDITTTIMKMRNENQMGRRGQHFICTVFLMEKKAECEHSVQIAVTMTAQELTETLLERRNIQVKDGDYWICSEVDNSGELERPLHFSEKVLPIFHSQVSNSTHVIVKKDPHMDAMLFYIKNRVGDSKNGMMKFREERSLLGFVPNFHDRYFMLNSSVLRMYREVRLAILIFVLLAGSSGTQRGASAPSLVFTIVEFGVRLFEVTGCFSAALDATRVKDRKD
ncbi:unnamed protein product [Ranitomeya imitator]|uniref:Ras-associating domain-containing protein n=1 Tax=Ranitomeya imitator TaxID=111125 RepID=A0ABN9KS32_9NEOB|nr:unnamed protein product [Ranitomeya imitator]